MIIDIVNKLIKPITIIALISIVAAWVFNVENVLVSDMVVDNIKIKVVDLRIYLNNLTNAWQSNALAFEEILPTRQWITTNASFVSSEFWNTLLNDLAFIFDWLYFPINFILWILRWICWLLKLALALIGWNVGQNQYGNYYSELVKILVWITEKLMIPYV